MVHIILSGKCNDPQFAKAEMLSYFLQKNLPDFNITIVPQHPNEYQSYLNKIYKENGWEFTLARDRKIKKPDNLNQCIWISSGQLIGNTDDFLVYVKESYGQESLIEDPDLLESIAQESSKSVGFIPEVNTDTIAQGIIA
ncbi:hypothetical protein BC833DRAFT_525316 [Globomyces pollinis-pini]|nr:hypothetical protein BC833DRAFT_525316 [Globomyces pollinis-pini]